MKTTILIFMSISILCFSCNQKEENQEHDWLKGSTDDKTAQIANHLRGFDIAMAEVGYRYKELYHAGETQNWEYANYQMSKIQSVIELAKERRPARAESANMFLENTIPQVKEAIDQKDQVVFNDRMQSLTKGCNSCHQIEGYEFIVIEKPASKISPVK